MKSDLLYVFAESFSKSTNAFQKWPLLSLTIKARARSSTGEFILLNVVECRLWTLSGRVCAMWGPKKKWTNVRGKTEFKLHWNWKTNDFCCETASWVQIKILLVLLWNSHTSVRSFICSGCLKSSMDYQLYLCCLICHGVFPGTKIKDKNTLGGRGRKISMISYVYKPFQEVGQTMLILTLTLASSLFHEIKKKGFQNASRDTRNLQTQRDLC